MRIPNNRLSPLSIKNSKRKSYPSRLNLGLPFSQLGKLQSEKPLREEMRNPFVATLDRDVSICYDQLERSPRQRHRQRRLRMSLERRNRTANGRVTEVRSGLSIGRSLGP